MVIALTDAQLLQEELIAAYGSEKVQEQLKSLNALAKKGQKQEFEALCQKEALLLELQKPIVSKYGFAASAKGVQDAMISFSTTNINLDPNVYKNNNVMERLLVADKPLDMYLTVFQLMELRNLGKYRNCPQDRFPIVPVVDAVVGMNGIVDYFPRGGIVSPKDTELLVAALLTGNAAKASQLLGARKVGSSAKAILVNLGYRSLGPKGVTTLAKALTADMESLELDLSGNNIGVEGAKAFAAGLPQALKVLKLNLASNRLLTAGVQAIAQALPQSLEVLHLGFTGMKMGPEGAKAIAMNMPPKVRDLSFDLHGNQVLDEGIIALSKALPKTLENLHVVLLDNQLSRRGLFAFDRQVGNPLHENYLPNLSPDNFKKNAELEIFEFKTGPDGRVHRQLDWRTNI